MDNYIISFIVELAKKSTKREKHYINRIQSPTRGDDYSALYNCRYLLGQILRQYDLKKGHCHISKAAIELWEELTSEPIDNYLYIEAIKCDRLRIQKEVEIFKGANNKSENKIIYPNKSIKINDLFTVEHIVPINRIMDDLVMMAQDKTISDNTRLEKAQKILDKIHVCLITKKEDRSINQKSNRDGNYKQIIENEYKEANIEVLR